MSSAFVKESEEQWLHDIQPTLNALIVYLTRENNGIRVYEKKNFVDKKGKEIYEMSNGLSYAKDDNSKWYVV
jgi:GTP cyclohydrolase II